MTRFAALLATSALVLAPALHAQETAQTEAPVDEVQKIEATADTVVATVNGQDITLGHLIVVRRGLPPEYQNLTDEQLFDGILNQMIQQAAVAEEPEGGLPRAVQLTLDNERRNILASEAVQKVADEAVTDEALQAAYDAQIADQPAEQEYNASHILVDTEEEAIEIVAQLEGGADFAELAKEKSTGPSGPNGGLLGWFGKGAMVPAFEAAVVALEAGAISAPVQTQFGWHVVKLNEVRDKPRPTLDDLRPRLADEIREAAARAYVDASSAAATVDRIDMATIDASAISNYDLLED